MIRQPRCPWAESNELMTRYHDEEWGVPVRDDNTHFAFLTLESAQAGLSWNTILQRREGYRAAFLDFDPVAVGNLTQDDVERLMMDARIIRNRLKITATINNALRFQEVQAACGSFTEYIWGFVDGRAVQNEWKRMEQLPASTPLSDAFAKDLKKRGFKFVGTTTVYAHLQAAGLVNDHLVSCFRYACIRSLGEQDM
ncbi:DNA-3-methyladenine glycosylase I [Desulfovibrio mangrovi]|uniref:DNA-3-methyladenine glycosylase I n=1 Tax=Desulfovibrio mangrovi TaxID=2976983 RepID=UPI0022456144|nr:DNA-3-methyladenine glycosylase I [Desulfovibrio mangrovi]UZP66704.1 DNA-3-methyladenine glycosylase I [Desulfovibrio mangrovi]